MCAKFQPIAIAVYEKYDLLKMKNNILNQVQMKSDECELPTIFDRTAQLS